MLADKNYKLLQYSNSTILSVKKIQKYSTMTTLDFLNGTEAELRVFYTILTKLSLSLHSDAGALIHTLSSSYLSLQSTQDIFEKKELFAMRCENKMV